MVTVWSVSYTHLGVQPSVTYVVCYGPCKQVGILDDHGKAAAQIVLFNGPYVNAVIGYASLLYFVETVHQINNGGLSCAGGTYERDFLPGFGVEAYAVQDGFLRRVSEHNLVETHIPLDVYKRQSMACGAGESSLEQ